MLMSNIDANAIVDETISVLDDVQSAIEEKGVDVPASTPASDYDDKIRVISVGGGEQIYGFDGVIELDTPFEPNKGYHFPIDIIGIYKVIERHGEVITNGILFVDNDYGIDQMYFDRTAHYHRDGDIYRVYFGDESGWECHWEKISVSQHEFEKAVGDIETALDNIIAIQNSLLTPTQVIGGDVE